jgi:hypothetical protein
LAISCILALPALFFYILRAQNKTETKSTIEAASANQMYPDIYDFFERSEVKINTLCSNLLWAN